MIPTPSIDLISLAPVLVLSVFGFAVLLLDLIVGRNKTLLVYVSLVGLLATVVSAFAKVHLPAYSFNGSYVVDNMSIFFVVIFTVSSALAILLSSHYNEMSFCCVLKVFHVIRKVPNQVIVFTNNVVF